MTLQSSAPDRRQSARETRGQFRGVLPRLYELRDMLVDPAHPDAFFQKFEDGLETSSGKLNAFLKLERQLAALDEQGWADLKERAAAKLLSKAGPGRGWQPLFDVFSEARAFGYLTSVGCTGVRFIRRSRRSGAKTPDLEAVRNGRPVLCEVKTINISVDEADRRRRIYGGETVASQTPLRVSESFVGKLRKTLEHAVEQLDGPDRERKAWRVAFVVVNFDDWVGDCQRQYFAQIDEDLLRSPIDGAEIVFCPASNLFERSFTMTSATVLPE